MSESKFVSAGIIGWPVGHSRSPAIHNHWIAKYGLKGAYMPLAVRPENLESAIKGLRALGFAGCNVTVPHKVNAMKLMDALHPTAKRIAAINTVVVMPDGSLHGFNNDGVGYIQSLKDADPRWSAKAGPALVLGAGGAARAIIAGLLDEGAPEVRVCNRTLEKAELLAGEFGGKLTAVAWGARNEAMANVKLLVNTTTQGMQGQGALEVQLDDLPPDAMVSDAIYIPQETPLLAQARQRGHRTVNGLGMLLNQARPAFNAWFGVMPEITDDLRRAIAATF